MIIIIYLIASFILLDCVMYSSWSSIQWRTFFKEDPLFLMVLALQPIRLRNLETLITFKENLPDKPFVLLWGNEDQTGHIQVWFYIFKWKSHTVQCDFQDPWSVIKLIFKKSNQYLLVIWGSFLESFFVLLFWISSWLNLLSFLSK